VTPREALIEKLVVSRHLNVPERQTLGSDEVSVAEVATVVKRLLERDGVFPLNAKPRQPREAVFEGFFLIKHPDGKVEMTVQRPHPIRPYELAERVTFECDDLDQAVLKFISSAWSKGIDGIPLSSR
jgi:hypothetical protein